MADIDFWRSGKKYKEMLSEHEDGIYPPKVEITPATKEKLEPNIKVSFNNLEQKERLNMDVTLFSGACIQLAIVYGCVSQGPRYGPLLGPAFRSLTEHKNTVLTFARFSGKGRHTLQ